MYIYTYIHIYILYILERPSSYGLATSFELAAKRLSQHCELGHPIWEPGSLLDRVLGKGDLRHAAHR